MHTCGNEYVGVGTRWNQEPQILWRLGWQASCLTWGWYWTWGLWKSILNCGAVSLARAPVHLSPAFGTNVTTFVLCCSITYYCAEYLKVSSRCEAFHQKILGGREYLGRVEGGKIWSKCNIWKLKNQTYLSIHLKCKDTVHHPCDVTTVWWEFCVI